MARGWEKEDHEMSDKSTQAAREAAESRRIEQDRQRQLQSLQLQRERILSERTSSPHRRSALEAALLEIEEKLAELGWSIHI
jgi:hypothetical protein